MEHITTVLVVDDEEDIVNLMRDFLEAEGYTVLTASDGTIALDTLVAASVDCVLLDVMMPGRSGFDVLRRIRETSQVPVLFLSARQEDSDKIRGLGLGGDDYVVKSATPGEIVARIKAVLRRTKAGEPTPASRLDFGRMAIDVRARELFIEGKPVALTPREFDLLQLFAEHPRQVLTRDQIFEQLWGPYGDRHSLTVHIGRLREKIEEDATNPRYIVTVWGVGYRFEGMYRS
ncbi:MAG: response regulator transcription factor [Chloroflexia bacterium]|jgi:DNA-binding response OmpR family regulator|nr:response regulator transcription factor [Chloroflexia bacterium]